MFKYIFGDQKEYSTFPNDGNGLNELTVTLTCISFKIFIQQQKNYSLTKNQRQVHKKNIYSPPQVHSFYLSITFIQQILQIM